MNEIIQGLMKFLKSYTNMKMQYILQGLVLSSYNGILHTFKMLSKATLENG